MISVIWSSSRDVSQCLVFGWSRPIAQEDEMPPAPQSLLAAICSCFQLHCSGNFLSGFPPSPLGSLLLFIFSFHPFPFLSHHNWGKKNFHFPCPSPVWTLSCQLGSDVSLAPEFSSPFGWNIIHLIYFINASKDDLGAFFFLSWNKTVTLCPRT